jgi:hypothetical protein
VGGGGGIGALLPLNTVIGGREEGDRDGRTKRPACPMIIGHGVGGEGGVDGQITGYGVIHKSNEGGVELTRFGGAVGWGSFFGFGGTCERCGALLECCAECTQALC